MKYSFIEKDVVISGEYSLGATITIPEQGQEYYPGILMIPGMGNVDRDENFKFLPMNILKELSYAIAEEGFVTLRYDKRGVGESGGSFYKTSFWNLVEDAKAALDFLKSQSYVDKKCIIVLGHSEGAIIASALYGKEKVDGVVLLCGFAYSLDEIIERRKNRILHDIEHQEGIKGLLFRLLKTEGSVKHQYAVAKKKIMNDQKKTLRIKGKKLNAQWLREHFRYNVMEDLKKIDCPTLVLGGSADVQSASSQVEEIAKAVKGPIESYVIQDLNHILRKDQTVNSVIGGVLDYWEQVEKPIDPEVIQILIRWLKNFKN